MPFFSRPWPIFSTHNPWYWKWYQTIPLCTHSLTLKFFGKFFSFEGARPEKGLKIWPFSKISKNKIFIFEYFSKIPSEMNSNDPFYPILIPNTPYLKFSIFLFLVVDWSQGVPKIYKYFVWYLKIVSNRFCKKIFLIKSKNKKKLYWVSQRCCQRVYAKFFEKRKIIGKRILLGVEVLML